MGESTFIFRGIRSEFQFSYNFLMKILANRIATDGTLHSAASHLWLYCLPMSHKRTQGLNELMLSDNFLRQFMFWGVQWPSSRAADFKSRGPGLEPHLHWVV